MSRIINSRLISEAIARLCREANYDLSADVVEALETAAKREESDLGREALAQMLENVIIAREESIPICQDTGLTIVFVEIGQDLIISGHSLIEAVNEGVREAYASGYLRKSVVSDPLFARKNTGDNTPAVIHSESVSGDRLRLTVLIKGGGSEGVGRAQVLKLAEGIDGLKRFVVEVVEAAGPNPCPPTIVGIGCGGTLDYAGFLAKKSLLRPLGQPNPDPKTAVLEADILEAVNHLGIGPAGLGGITTSLAVHIETYPSHIATMPVAVDLSCYALRRKEEIL